MDGAAFTRSALVEPDASRSTVGRSLAMGLVVFALGMGFGVTTRDPAHGGVDVRAAVHALGARASALLGRTSAAATPALPGELPATAPLAATPATAPLAATPAIAPLVAMPATVRPPMLAGHLPGASAPLLAPLLDAPMAEAEAPTDASIDADAPAEPPAKLKKRRRKARRDHDAARAAEPGARESVVEVVAPARKKGGGYAPLSVLVPRTPRPSAAYAQACSGAPGSPAAALATGNYDAAAAQLACAQLRDAD